MSSFCRCAGCSSDGIVHQWIITSLGHHLERQLEIAQTSVTQLCQPHHKPQFFPGNDDIAVQVVDITWFPSGWWRPIFFPMLLMGDCSLDELITGTKGTEDSASGSNQVGQRALVQFAPLRVVGRIVQCNAIVPEDVLFYRVAQRLLCSSILGSEENQEQAARQAEVRHQSERARLFLFMHSGPRLGIEMYLQIFHRLSISEEARFSTITLMT
jgi:hypothetical protein